MKPVKPVQPEELSALLDGELDGVRAREVEARMATDPALRLEYEALAASDADWRAAAGSAAFTPVASPFKAETDRRGIQTLMMTLAALVASRIVMKLAASEALVLGLSAISLGLLLTVVVAIVRTDQRRSFRYPGSSPPAHSSR
jgi:anti-sigma factor RsiW